MAPRPVQTDATATAVATRAENGVQPGKTIAQFLTDPGMKRELQRAAASAFDVDHLMRITLTLIRKTPALGQCSQASLAGAMMMSAELGLDPGVLGMVYYVPFNNKVKLSNGQERWEQQVQFIIGYKGLLELVRRSNQVASV
jgi:recombination protein RecT